MEYGCVQSKIKYESNRILKKPFMLKKYDRIKSLTLRCLKENHVQKIRFNCDFMCLIFDCE